MSFASSTNLIGDISELERKYLIEGLAIVLPLDNATLTVLSDGPFFYVSFSSSSIVKLCWLMILYTVESVAHVLWFLRCRDVRCTDVFRHNDAE